MKCPFCNVCARDVEGVGLHINRYHYDSWEFDVATQQIVCLCGWRTSVKSQYERQAFIRHLLQAPDDHLLHYRLGG